MNGKELFRKQCEFKIGATKVEHIPVQFPPEVAMIGRSNVGKSSLLNALTNNSNLARTSKKPGCTQQINFFDLADGALMLVDLPGYGYAKASRKEVAGWGKLMHDYLLNRPNLRQACLLVDSRHGLKNSDREMMSILDEAAVSYQLILTKCDKSSAAGRAAIVDEIMAHAKKHPALHPEVIETSSTKGNGIEALRNRLAQFTK